MRGVLLLLICCVVAFIPACSKDTPANSRRGDTGDKDMTRDLGLVDGYLEKCGDPEQLFARLKRFLPESVHAPLREENERETLEGDGTDFLTVGSTGATGLEFFVEGNRPYEAEVIYFRDGEPIAVDYITFEALGDEFEIDRQRLDDE